MTIWDDLNARARGLGTHLLGRATLEHLAHARDLTAVATALASRGYAISESDRGSGSLLELAVRRGIAQRMRVLARWAGTRTGMLAVIFEDEDRRSITALLRGAAQRAPANLRVSGLIPTPELPERALGELARQPTPRAVTALLAAWRHPLASELIDVASRPEPDLLALETALSRAFAKRALSASRRAGRRGRLFHYVQQVIDLENAYTALILSEDEKPRPADHWLPGGRAITLDLAERAAASGDPATAADLLGGGFRGTRLAAVFAHPDHQPAGLELAVLGAQIAEFRARSRVEPLSVAFLLGFALRLRAEALDVRRVIWGISLGAPARTLIEGLVTAA
jgi:vacuolar-type H+-ATPase subunit C/Vma6